MRAIAVTALVALLIMELSGQDRTGVPGPVVGSPSAHISDGRSVELESMLRGLPALLQELGAPDVQRHERAVTAYYIATGGGRVRLTITVEAFDTDDDAEAGRKRSEQMTSAYRTRQEVVGGILCSMWENGRLLGRIGRHVVDVTAAYSPGGDPLVRTAFEGLVTALDGLRIVGESGRPRGPNVPQLVAVVPELPRLVIEYPAATPLDAATLKQYTPTVDVPDSDARNGFRLDLNGDGQLDVVRTYGPNMCGTGGCPMEIFDGLTHKSLGDVFGDPVWVFPTMINGWPTLGVYSHGSATSGSYSTFVFDGQRYVAVSSVYLRDQSVEELFKRFRLTTKAR